MPYPKTEQELVALFKKLGAHSPEGWVPHVLADPEPQLARYLFLKQAWEGILGEGDVSWINESIERAKVRPTEPYSGLGLALDRLLVAGASRKDISEIARCLQAQMLFNLGYLLGGPVDEEPGLEEIDWRLFRVNEDGIPFGDPIAGLHESVLETDPTGREMRPKT